MKNLLVEKNWHRLFEFGIGLKAFNGVWELISGSALLLISKNSFTRLLLHFSRGELLEDPHDRLINFFATRLQLFSTDTKIFVAAYILAHGILNLFLAVQLYRQRLWAYLVTISAMALFMTYQIYRIAHTHSVALTVITLWDAAFIIITWHEYRYQKSKLFIKNS